VSFFSGQNTMEKGETLCSGQEFNRGFAVAQAISWSTNSLQYPGSYLVNVLVYLEGRGVYRVLVG
jgi:hypothetical protein